MIKITEKYSCTGCHACSNICPKQCIKMEVDKEGFLYPKVDEERCVDCGLCEKICPVLNNVKVDNEPLAYACFNKNEQIRLESSSGGIFTPIAEQIINDGGVVFGVGLDKDLTALHSYGETKEELKTFRRSKYFQSKIGEAYKTAEQFLKQNRKVLFSGTPCQIGGLKAYLQKDYDNLICADIICHGVPSPKVWENYLAYHEKRLGAKAESANFRHKNKGWNKFSMALEFDSGNKYIKTLDKDLYMRAFLKDTCLRPSCHKCNFKTLHRQSDITLADFWGINKVLPKMDDDKGTSLLIINSKNGKAMFDSLKDNIYFEEVDLNKAVSYNPAAFRSVIQNPNRENFFRDLDNLSFDKLVNKYCSESITEIVKRKVKITAVSVLEDMGLLDFAKKVLKRGE